MIGNFDRDERTKLEKLKVLFKIYQNNQCKNISDLFVRKVFLLVLILPSVWSTTRA